MKHRIIAELSAHIFLMSKWHKLRKEVFFTSYFAKANYLVNRYATDDVIVEMDADKIHLLKFKKNHVPNMLRRYGMSGTTGEIFGKGSAQPYFIKVVR